MKIYLLKWYTGEYSFIVLRLGNQDRKSIEYMIEILQHVHYDRFSTEINLFENSEKRKYRNIISRNEESFHIKKKKNPFFIKTQWEITFPNV